MQKIIPSVLAILITGCSSNPKFVSPANSISTPDINWSAEEKQQAVSVRTLSTGKHSSSHIVRLNQAETPHYHDRHDLLVTVLYGNSRINFKNKSIDMKAGDIVSIPAKTYHWAENTGDDACIVIATFSPGFDGKDRLKAD